VLNFSTYFFDYHPFVFLEKLSLWCLLGVTPRPNHQKKSPLPRRIEALEHFQHSSTISLDKPPVLCILGDTVLECGPTLVARGCLSASLPRAPKKRVFWGETTKNQAQCKDLETATRTATRTPCGIPKNPIQDKNAPPGIRNFVWRVATAGLKPLAVARPSRPDVNIRAWSSRPAQGNTNP